MMALRCALVLALLAMAAAAAPHGGDSDHHHHAAAKGKQQKHVQAHHHTAQRGPVRLAPGHMHATPSHSRHHMKMNKPAKKSAGPVPAKPLRNQAMETKAMAYGSHAGQGHAGLAKRSAQSAAKAKREQVMSEKVFKKTEDTLRRVGMRSKQRKKVSDTEKELEAGLKAFKTGKHA